MSTEKFIREFNFNEFKIVSYIDSNNNPWFKGKDIAEILEYKDTNQAVRKHININDKNTYGNLQKSLNTEHINSTVYLKYYNDINTIFINESGLYSLILKSKMSLAVNFQRWVTSELLPSIRKYGEYKLIREKDQLTNKLLLEKEQLTQEKELIAEKLTQEKELITKELEHEKLEIQKAERRSLRLKEKLIEGKKKEENQVVYIATSESYAKQNRFKIGGVESLSYTKGRLSNYNSRSANGDEYYYCYMKKVHNYRAFEHRFWDILSSFRDKQSKEIIILKYSNLKSIFDFIVENYYEDVKFINENVREFIDNLNDDFEVPEPLNMDFYEVVQIREGKVKKIELSTSELEPKIYEVVKNMNEELVTRKSVFENLEEEYKFDKRVAWRILREINKTYSDLKSKKINYK